MRASTTVWQNALAAFPQLGLSRTRKGALVARWPGAADDAPRALTAHVDTLGAMVKLMAPEPSTAPARSAAPRQRTKVSAARACWNCGRDIGTDDLRAIRRGAERSVAGADESRAGIEPEGESCKFQAVQPQDLEPRDAAPNIDLNLFSIKQLHRGSAI